MARSETYVANAEGVAIALISVGFIGLLFVAAVITQIHWGSKMQAVKMIWYKNGLIVRLIFLSLVGWASKRLSWSHWIAVHEWNFGGAPFGLYEWLQVFLIWAVLYFFLVCYW